MPLTPEGLEGLYGHTDLDEAASVRIAEATSDTEKLREIRAAQNTEFEQTVQAAIDARDPGRMLSAFVVANRHKGRPDLARKLAPLIFEALVDEQGQGCRLWAAIEKDDERNHFGLGDFLSDEQRRRAARAAFKEILSRSYNTTSNLITLWREMNGEDEELRQAARVIFVRAANYNSPGDMRGIVERYPNFFNGAEKALPEQLLQRNREEETARLAGRAS
jgi:hypothetical protein